ncbi:MAG TPA: P-type conjugative transfer protein TrbJ [Sphingomicrobium sp.]|jgi:P-type conjugative transfer protein TrbJ|nr:P-type conjugative transfer protein TrbJ [Sphingomicrobium sp.]
MKAFYTALRIASLTSTLGLSAALPTVPVNATEMPVFDAANYSQNLIEAARALEQINNQVTSLRNEAGMLQNMATNLQKIDFPQLQQLTSSMQQINQLITRAQGIDFTVQGLDQRVQQLFPGALQQALTSDQQVTNARARLDAARSAYLQSIQMQAQVAENVQADAGALADLAKSSQGSVGALQVGQASNQLLALSIKQQLQIQNLMATEFRETAIERARHAQAEEDGRATTRRFLEGPTSN